MARLVLLVLLLQQWNLQLCRADFSFTLSIFTHSTSGNCFGDDISGACETFFSLFCLRGGRTSSSTSRTDCPLGRDTEDFFDASGSRTITSVQPWTVSKMNDNVAVVRTCADEEGPMCIVYQLGVRYGSLASPVWVWCT